MAIQSITPNAAKALHSALVSAFSREELRQLVYFRLGVELDNIVAPGSKSSIVFDLILWAQNNGRTADLVSAAHAANPDNFELKEFVTALEAGDSFQSASIVSQAQLTEAGATPGLWRQVFDRLWPSMHRRLTLAGTLSLPPELARTDEYLRWLRAVIQHEFREKTYLPLAGRSVPRDPLAGAGSAEPFVSPIQQVILQLSGRSEGGDSASAQLAALNRRSRTVRNIVRAISRSPDPLVLLGEPGSGKTMTLQQTAMELADSEIRRVFPLIPIYVRLGDFHKNTLVGPDDVRQFLQEETNPILHPLLHGLERSGRLVILFDGMDEMSRDRYGEHTEALSLFAGSTPSSTLFSCRITDFSPRFIHRRLVLLPFDRRQIDQYLSQYIRSFPIEIDGLLWKRKELAKEISAGDLAVEADNPFVLWLLCLYLQNTGSWPSSRVQLLEYYNKENYIRKQEELADDEPRFAPMPVAFDSWGAFAYAITQRNSGSLIPVAEFAAEQNSDLMELEKMIWIGHRCGVLKESTESYQHMARFQHHRFQEYFTAYHIFKEDIDVDWLGKFDAPRWQETMLNLILMGQVDVLDALAESIQKHTQLLGAQNSEGNAASGIATEDNEPDLNLAEPLQAENGTADPAQTETMDAEAGENAEGILADRVEFASRILRQGATTVPEVNSKLRPAFTEAVSILAVTGNPITQVKMVRAALNVPEMDYIETLREPLNSPINWVRDQALLLIGGSGRAVGSNLATEMGYDLAGGQFLHRIPVYARAARKPGSQGALGMLLAGGFTFVLTVLFLILLNSALFFAALQTSTLTSTEAFANFEAIDYSVLEAPWAFPVYLLVMLIVALLALSLSPARLWQALTAAALVLVTTFMTVPLLWQGNLSATGATIGIIALYLYLMLILMSIGAVAAIFVPLALFLVLTSGQRHRQHRPRVFFQKAWRDQRVSVLLPTTLGEAFFYLLFPLFFVVLYPRFEPTIGPVIEPYLTSLKAAAGAIPLPFEWYANLFVVAALVAVAISIAAMIIKSIRGSTADDFGLSWWSSVIVMAIFSLIIGLIFAALGALLRGIMNLIDRFGIQLGLGRVLAAIIVLAVLLVLIYFARRPISRILTVLRPRKLRSRSYSPERWMSVMEEADRHKQQQILALTTPQSVGLTAAEYLELLKEIEWLIEEEPAASTYWSQRDELAEALRQERLG